MRLENLLDGGHDKVIEVEIVVETVLETRPRDNITPRRGGDVPQ